MLVHLALLIGVVSHWTSGPPLPYTPGVLQHSLSAAVSGFDTGDGWKINVQLKSVFGNFIWEINLVSALRPMGG